MFDMPAGMRQAALEGELEAALRIMGLEALLPGQVAPELQEPLIRAAKLWEAALAPNTRRARASDLRGFAAWALGTGVEPLGAPARLSDLMEAHHEALGRSKAPASAKRASSSLAGLAKALGTDAASRGAAERRRLLVRATVVSRGGPPL